MEKNLKEMTIGAKGLNFFRITVAVLKKSEKKPWKNGNKEGIRFGVLVVDKEGTTAECTSLIVSRVT